MNILEKAAASCKDQKERCGPIETCEIPRENMISFLAYPQSLGPMIGHQAAAPGAEFLFIFVPYEEGKLTQPQSLVTLTLERTLLSPRARYSGDSSVTHFYSTSYIQLPTDDMKMKLIYALSAVAPLIAALPGPQYGGGGGGCISQSAAETLVSRYAAVIAQQSSDLGGPVKTARAIAAQNYQEQSDSANQQIGIPLGAITTASKHDFVVESQNNPPLVTQTQNVFTGSCNMVVWEWVSVSFGNGDYPVQGIHVFTVTDTGKITRVHFEFNSFAGALDNGYTIYYPNGTQYPS